MRKPTYALPVSGTAAFSPASPHSVWMQPIRRIALGPGEVHVWRIFLGSRVGREEYCSELLCDRERIRAEEYFFQKDRARFVVVRAVLRQILGSYLDLAPGRVPIVYGSRGKPMIEVAEGIPPLHFNVAHSRDLGLIAVACDCRVGVDLESVRLGFEWMTVARRYFSTRELTSILGSPSRQQAEAFFAGWTRKEACLKAIGCGLTGWLEEIEVSTDQRDGAVLLAAPQEMLPVSRWRIVDLMPGEGYRACLVVESAEARVKLWDWPGQPLEDRPPSPESYLTAAGAARVGLSPMNGSEVSNG